MASSWSCVTMMVVMPTRRCRRPPQLHLHALAELGVERRQRLVEQEQRGIQRQRPRHRDPLAHPARELGDALVGHVGQLHQREQLLRPREALAPPHAADAQAVGDVLGHRQVREQGVRLEHHAHVAAVHGDAGEVAVAEPQVAGRGRLEARDDAQERGLAAAGGPDEADQRTAREAQVDAVQGHGGAEALTETLDHEVGAVGAHAGRGVRARRGSRGGAVRTALSA